VTKSVKDKTCTSRNKLQLGAHLFDFIGGSFLQFLELHCQTHVSLDFDFSLEECLLGIELSGHEVDDVFVVDCESHVSLD